MATMKVAVSGMHCKSCVLLVGEELKRCACVGNVVVNLSKGEATVAYEGEAPSMEEMRAKLEKFGYGLAEGGEKSTVQSVESPVSSTARLAQWVLAFALAGAMIFAYLLLTRSGIVERLMPGVNANNGLPSAGVALLVGLVASLSTCFAVVGSIVIAFGELYADTRKGLVRANLLFHAGRIGGFGVLGGVLGAIGGTLSLSGTFVSIVTIAVAVVMFFLGLRILGIVPPLANLGISMPGPLATFFYRLKRSRNPVAPLVLGALTFFLPCGFTQSMQVLALGSGSVFNGAAIMALFALGTVPVLFVAGISASWTRSRNMAVIGKTAGLLVIAFAVVTFLSGASLSGFNGNLLGLPDAGAQNSDSVSDSPVAGEDAAGKTQTVEIHVTYQGFEPNILKVKAGIPVKWIIHGDQVTGCTNRIIIPSMRISTPVKSGQNVVTFTPEKKGKLGFSCWMGMVRGTFVVE